jgi:hypothetical protein
MYILILAGRLHEDDIFRKEYTSFSEAKKNFDDSCKLVDDSDKALVLIAGEFTIQYCKAGLFHHKNNRRIKECEFKPRMFVYPSVTDCGGYIRYAFPDGTRCDLLQDGTCISFNPD